MAILLISIFLWQLCEKKVDDATFAALVKKQTELLAREREQQLKPAEPAQVGLHCAELTNRPAYWALHHRVNYKPFYLH